MTRSRYLSPRPMRPLAGLLGSPKRRAVWRPHFETLENRRLLANLPPLLTAPPDQMVPSSQETIVVPLIATDPDEGDVLTFSAIANSREYHLDQSIGLVFTGDFSLNFGGLNEKWLLGDGGQEWYYVLPSAQLWKWHGGATTNASLIASLHADVYDNPSLLYDAVPGNGPALLSIENSALSIDPWDGFSGSFSIDVTVSDGTLSDSKQLVVTVSENRAPVLVDPGPQSLLTTQGSLSLPLTASDPDGDLVVLSAAAHSGEYYLDQEIDLRFTGDYSLNFGGLDEKWVVTANGTTYFPAGRSGVGLVVPQRTPNS